METGHESYDSEPEFLKVQSMRIDPMYVSSTFEVLRPEIFIKFIFIKKAIHSMLIF